MKALGIDLKVGLRQFAKSPGSTILAIVAYAVGLGLVGLMLTLLFGVVRAHPEDMDFDTIQMLSWDDSTRHLWTNGAQNPQLRYRDFKELQESQEVFEALAASRNATFNVVVDTYAERFTGDLVTSDYFNVLGVQPELGSFFEKGDDAPSAPAKAVISYNLWKNHFDRRESIVGDHLTINGVPTIVVGIAREGFDFPSVNDIWVNERVDPLSLSRGEGDVYFVSGILKDGITPVSALASLNTIAKRFEKSYPDTNTGYIAFELNPLSEIYLSDNFKQMVFLMLSCSGLVLLIACTNVANLTLSRATTRVKELAIRASLGGRRIRLVLQMIVEGLSIAILGGFGGLIIAIWTSKAIWAWANEGDVNSIPSWMNMDVDLQVIAAVLALTLISSVAASIVPAVRASRADVNEILKDNTRGATGLRMGFFSKMLAFLQLCVSCGLLIATSAMVSTAKETAVFEPPYDPSGMMVARFDLPETYYGGDQRADGLHRLQNLLESNEALEGVGFTSAFDMIFNWPTRWEVRGIENLGDDGFTPARHEIVSDNYFELLEIPILEGRGFDSIDRGPNAQQVCVINQVLADRLWPDESPIGHQIRDVWTDTNPWLTIIGLVPDTKMAGPGPRAEDQLGGVYRPMSVAPQPSVTVFVRTLGDPMAQAQHIRSVLRNEDESIALYRIKTVEDAIKESNFGPLFYRNMFGMFGIGALALASIGVYGVMNFSIRQRFHEFGIRQALGAGRSTVMNQIFRMGSLQTVIGIIIGSALGWVLIMIIGQDFGGMMVTAGNYLIPIAVIVIISFFAVYTPARYVAGANLADCLRDE